MFQPGGAGYFVPTMPQAQRGFFNPAQMAQVRPSPRWQTPQQGTRPAVPTGAAAGFQAMQQGTTQIRQARPTTQGTVRAAMNARPITGQQPTAAQRVAGKFNHSISTAPLLVATNSLIKLLLTVLIFCNKQLVIQMT